MEMRPIAYLTLVACIRLFPCSRLEFAVSILGRPVDSEGKGFRSLRIWPAPSSRIILSVRTYDAVCLVALARRKRPFQSTQPELRAALNGEFSFSEAAAANKAYSASLRPSYELVTLEDVYTTALYEYIARCVSMCGEGKS